MAHNSGHDWDAIAEMANERGWGYKRVAREVQCSDSTAKRALRKRRCRWCKGLGKLGRDCCPDADAVSVAPDFPCDPRDAESLMPEGVRAGWFTTQVGPDGKIERQWMRTSPEREAFLAGLAKIGEQLKGEAPDPTPWNGPPTSADLLNLFPLGDPHVGALSWALETGQDWNTDIAERVHVDAVNALLARAPKARRALIMAMGDLFHANSRKALTPHSGHLLDVDTRFPKTFHIGARMIRRAVQAALETHEQVDVIILSGNHDPDAAMALAYSLACYFHREPRVRVDLRVSKYRYYVWGRCLIGAVHGDTRKTQKLGGVMLNEWPDLAGRCAHRAWYTGHLHNDRVHTLDDGSMVHQVETLAARDAYAAEGGWATRRSLSCHVWHRLDGHKDILHERLPHHRAQKLAPMSDVDGWDPAEGIQIDAAE